MITVKLWQEEETINCTYSLAVRVVNGQEHKVLVNDEDDDDDDIHLEKKNKRILRMLGQCGAIDW